MNSMNFDIDINAPKQKVWDVMLDPETYKEWTTAFMPGGYYEGSWEKGSKIRFLAPEEDGKLSGMLSQIVENRPYEFISIEHLGEVHDGQVDTDSGSAKQWVGAHENYTFTEQNGVTTVKVDLEGANISQEMQNMFNDMWPPALQKLKEIAER